MNITHYEITAAYADVGLPESATYFYLKSRPGNSWNIQIATSSSTPWDNYYTLEAWDALAFEIKWNNTPIIYAQWLLLIRCIIQIDLSQLYEIN